MIRPFHREDLVWIKPIALKYQEWPAARDTLLSFENYFCLASWVVEEKAVVAFYEYKNAPMVTYVCGLCGEEGIRDLFNLGRYVTTAARRVGIPLLSPPLEAMSWQLKFYEKMGFEPIEPLGNIPNLVFRVGVE